MATILVLAHHPFDLPQIPPILTNEKDRPKDLSSCPHKHAPIRSNNGWRRGNSMDTNHPASNQFHLPERMDTPPFEIKCADDVLPLPPHHLQIMDISLSKCSNLIAVAIVDGSVEMFGARSMADGIDTPSTTRRMSW